jgi:RNA polymerase sigma-70 factor (ECF subfamily)
MTGMTANDSDEMLIQARINPQEGLGPLLEQHRSYLSLLARVQIGRRLQGKADSADLVQETFLEAHRHFSLFQGRTAAEFVQWLRQILAGRLAKLVRRYLGTKGRDVRLEQDLEWQLTRSSDALGKALVAGHSTPSQQAVRREHAVLLAQALDRLPKDYREVLILRHLEECAFAEVARRMGRTVESVKKLWARALPRLRELFEEVL